MEGVFVWLMVSSATFLIFGVLLVVVEYLADKLMQYYGDE